MSCKKTRQEKNRGALVTGGRRIVSRKKKYETNVPVVLIVDAPRERERRACAAIFVQEMATVFLFVVVFPVVA